MPALVAHHHFAVHALKLTPPHVQAAVSSAPAAFRWGAQGPDILYFHNPPLPGKLPRLGGTMHRYKILRCFQTLSRLAARKNVALYYPYLAGFLCHYILDRTAHPYVMAMIEQPLTEPYEELSDSAKHKTCESDLDAAVIHNYISGEQYSFRSSSLLPGDRYTQQEIGRLMAQAAWDVYGVSIKAGQVARSMTGMIQAYSFLHDENGKRREEIRGLEALINQRGELSSLIRPLAPLPEDCANLRRQPWHVPGESQEHTETFFELMEQAMPTAADLMERLYDHVRRQTPLPEQEFTLNYLGQPEDNG